MPPEPSASTRPAPLQSESSEQLIEDFGHLGIAVTTQNEQTVGKRHHGHRDNDTRGHPQQSEAESSSKSKQDNIVQHPDSPSGAHHAARERSALPEFIQPRHLPRDTFDKTTAEPVTQETVKRVDIEVQHKVVHKDIHEYHEVTRILPIVERTILPARHFVQQADGTKIEIAPPPATTAKPTPTVAGVNSEQPAIDPNLRRKPTPAVARVMGDR